MSDGDTVRLVYIGRSIRRDGKMSCNFFRVGAAIPDIRMPIDQSGVLNFADKGGVKSLKYRFPGAIYEVQDKGAGRFNFSNLIPVDNWNNKDDVLKWQIADRAANAQSIGMRNLKDEIEDVLKQQLEPIHDQYRYMSGPARGALLARVIYLITRGT